MILVVEDTKKFHDANLTMNYKHYSYFAKRLPLDITDTMHNLCGCGLYFNPLINLTSFSTFADDTRKIKYGIISEAKALQDLTSWESFGFAGRMQKPVLHFIRSSE
jgi:hypothetical protein